MFEKVHVNEFRKMTLEEMDDLFDDIFLLPVTKKERQWLKSVLLQKESDLFLSPELQQKLAEILIEEKPDSYLQSVDEKFIVKDDNTLTKCEIDLFKKILEIITNKSGMKITYKTRAVLIYELIKAVPFKLEFSAVKNEWYVLWLGIEEDTEFIMSTPLKLIKQLDRFNIEKGLYLNLRNKFFTILENEKLEAVVKINQSIFKKHNRNFKEEKERILYSFSCFDKEVFFDEQSSRYEVHIYYRKNEEGEFLKRVRLLGERIILVSPDELRKKLFKTAEQAYMRYEN